jgi:ribosome biogenesis GTPase
MWRWIMLKQGKIIRIVSNSYSVSVDNEIIECLARGKFRCEKITPLVGDLCEIDYENKYILKILPRKNYLLRPSIANVDAALIVTSVKMPELSLNLLDKMLSVITINKITPIICFSKLDLLENNEKKEIKKIIKYYKKIGYIVLTNKEIYKLNKVLKDKIVVITGQTGAGKSTLINKLDKKLNLKTDEISLSLGRGKHTTRHTELFKIKKFYIADTPGFSSLDFNNISKEEIKESFLEFKKYSCKFNDCMHIKEKGCSIIEHVNNNDILKSRYENYLSFVNGGKV